MDYKKSNSGDAMATTTKINKVAVLGAGVMGAQIAAHCVNVGANVVLFDLVSEGDRPNKIAETAFANLLKLKPAPLTIPENAKYISLANYRDDLELLEECDLVIEAVAERIDIKASLFEMVTPYITDTAIFASNTSGLSINELAEKLPEKLRARFLGIHFFNPPRYMHLTEIIPCNATEDVFLDGIESFLVSGLGKGVIRAKDTPNFIANRIGVFSLLSTIVHAERFSIPFDTVDALTGLLIGRPKSATFRTLDVVGLDTMAHVVNTMRQLSNDPWVEYFKEPKWLTKLIEQGALGQKSGAGIYKKTAGKIHVLNPKIFEYTQASGQVDESIKALFASHQFPEVLLALRDNEHPQAQFLWACFRDVFHYCAFHAADIAHSTRDIDLAMRWGFGWQRGPFEIWQQASFSGVYDALSTDLEANQCLSEAKLPDWLNQIEKFHQLDKSYSPGEQAFVSPPELPVYERALTKDDVYPVKLPLGDVIYENAGVVLSNYNNVAILSFKSPKNVFGSAVIEGVIEAIGVAENKSQALVLWQKDQETFSLGANLKEFAPQFATASESDIAAVVERFQHMAMRLKYATIPTVAAVRGRALGGAVEVIMHCSAAVCAMESYTGLVEVGVGLIPAGGGCKELALRAEQHAIDGDPYPGIEKYFQQVAMGKVAMSATEAINMAYTPRDTTVIANTHEVLFVALAKAKALAATAYRPPLNSKIKVAGIAGIANLQTLLVNMHKGSFITDYEYELGLGIAKVICGGEVDAGSIVDAAWILKLERETFAHFAKQANTQVRIKHMLTTGKPLRN